MDFNLLRLGVTSANPWISTVVLACGVLRVPVVHLLTRIVSQSRDLTCLWSPRGLAYRTADPPPPLPSPRVPAATWARASAAALGLS